jgi:hypothetical protein
MNDDLEAILKEVVVAWSVYCPGICFGKLINTTKILSQVTRWHGRDSNRALSD